MGTQGARELPALRGRPLAFLFHYARRHTPGHLIILIAVLAAVVCSISTQYGLKTLIDIVAAGPHAGRPVWGAFALLCGLIAADNLFWRVGGFVAARSFVAVTGDIRRDLAPADLAARPGPYRDLLRTQLMEPAPRESLPAAA